MSKEELKTCPFCKKAGEIYKYYGAGSDRVHYEPRCKDRECIAKWLGLNFITEAEAITAWNRRAK